jgi:hypothetical protein
VLYDLKRVAEDVGIKVPFIDSSRSKYQPEMLVKPLTRYLMGGVMGNYDGILLNKAYMKVRRMFYVGKLNPVPLDKVVYRTGTNAGAPTFTKKWEDYERAIREVKAIRRGMCPPPLAVFHRGKNEEEVRPVFAYPFSMTLLESQFFEAYQYEVMNHHNPYVGGRSPTVLSGDISELRWKSSHVMQLDYSGFDGSISKTLVSMGFGVIRNCFTLTEQEESDWEKVITYFLTAPWLLPDGNLLIGRRHGVSSGSMFTQLIDSIVNCIVIEYVRLKCNLTIPRYYVLGDDSLVGVVGKAPDLKAVATAASELGITVNLAKSAVNLARQPHHYFLGHEWFKGYGTRPVPETWERVLTPEKPQRDFFSKDSSAKRKAYIERLRAYQDDNPDVFHDLQLVINELSRLPGVLRESHAPDPNWNHWTSSKPAEERLAWDKSLDILRSQRIGNNRWVYQMH